MNVYTGISFTVNDNGIISINVEKIYKLENDQFELKNFNVSDASSAIINFKKEDSIYYLLFNDIKMEQSVLNFDGFLYDKDMEEYGMDIKRGVYQLRSFNYELPANNFLLASNFISLFDNYSRKVGFCQYFKTPFKDQIKDQFVDGKLNTSLDNFFDCGSSSFMYDELEISFEREYWFLSSINKLIANAPLYQSIIAKNQGFHDFCKLAGLPPAKFLNNLKLNHLIETDHNPCYLINDQLDPSKRSAIIDLIKGNTHQAKTNKWSMVLQNANVLIDEIAPIDWREIVQQILRVKLYDFCMSSCQGKIAHDNKKFSMKKRESFSLANLMPGHSESDGSPQIMRKRLKEMHGAVKIHHFLARESKETAPCKGTYYYISLLKKPVPQCTKS